MLYHGRLATFLTDLTHTCLRHGIGLSGDVYALDLGAMPGITGYTATEQDGDWRITEDDDLGRWLEPPVEVTAIGLKKSLPAV